MATKPSIPAVVVGQKVSAAAWNAGVVGAWQFEDAQRPIFYAAQSVAQAVPTGFTTFTAITFASEIIDRDNQHSTTTNTSRVNIGNTLGWYEASGVVNFAAVASGGAGEQRRAGILLNGAAVPDTNMGSQIILPYFTGTNSLVSVVVPPIVLQATASTDYIELGCGHNNAATINTSVSGSYRSHFRVVYLGS